MTDLYKGYYKNHAYGLQKIDFSPSDKELQRKIGKYIDNFSNPKVLEIGSGQGKFTHFCKEKGVKQYTGLELDDEMVIRTKELFPEFTVLSQGVLDFFNQSSEKFDIIFMSHVLEHFTIEEGIEVATLIYKNLNPGGTWINLMPNGANAGGTGLRYCDITHKTIYTITSYNQILKIGGFSENNIHHSGTFPTLNPIVAVIYFLFRHISFRILQYITHNIYSLELLTVSYKK